MALEVFNLARLAEMDAGPNGKGRMAEAFNLALQRCIDDMRDRPATKKPRKLSLIVDMRPIVGDDGALESVNVGFDFKESIPPRQSKVYNMQAGRAGLLVNELSPEDVKQATLDQAPGYAPAKGAKSNAG